MQFFLIVVGKRANDCEQIKSIRAEKGKEEKLVNSEVYRSKISDALLLSSMLMAHVENILILFAFRFSIYA